MQRDTTLTTHRTLRFINPWESALVDALSKATRYFEHVCEWVPVGWKGIANQLPSKNVRQYHSIRNRGSVPSDKGGIVIVSGVLAMSEDLVSDLKSLAENVSESDVVLMVQRRYSLPVGKRVLRRILRRDTEWAKASARLNSADLSSICRLVGLEVTHMETVWPFGLRLFKRIPVLSGWSPFSIATVRKKALDRSNPTVSIVIPVRNEAGNIPALFDGIQEWESLPALEVILVEGNSSDGTLEILRQHLDAYRGNAKIRLLQQSGRGKADAVRMGLREAHNKVLVIFDSDLTVAPKEVLKFYEAISLSKGDLIVGTRMFYPQERGAMRPLNFVGNYFFTVLVNQLFGLKLTDLLCGTKVMHRRSYERFQQWRWNNGEKDPFGDFELIFAATQMHLRIFEIPVHYRARRYGQTNIRRMRDGLRLLKLTLDTALFS